jgi:hypothetical protein
MLIKRRIFFSKGGCVKNGEGRKNFSLEIFNEEEQTRKI